MPARAYSSIAQAEGPPPIWCPLSRIGVRTGSICLRRRCTIIVGEGSTSLNPFSMSSFESYRKISCVPVPISTVRIFMIDSSRLRTLHQTVVQALKTHLTSRCSCLLPGRVRLERIRIPGQVWNHFPDLPGGNRSRPAHDLY